MSQRSQDRKSKAHKERGRTQRSRDPKKIRCPREARRENQTHTSGGDGPREAGSLTKQKLSQRGQLRKANHTNVEDAGMLRRKACPREARTENQKRTRSGEGPREAGTIRKKMSQRSQLRKANHTSVEDAGTLRKKACPREARTENQKRTRSGEGPREAGTLRK